MQWPTEDTGFLRSVAVILVSEIGDKTFLLAAILAMRHPRTIVFAGALGALAVMSVLSAMLGHVVPTLLPKKWTTISAAILFLVFGAKMLQEGLAMESGSGAIEEELREVTKEIEDAEYAEGGNPKRLLTGARRSEANGIESMEEGNAAPLPKKSKNSGNKISDSVMNLANLIFSPIFVQTFIMTFLAEWGDRSQITTIALGAAHNVWIVSVGTIIGHSVCTLAAVMGGRAIANRISIKNVTLGGAVLFLIFAMVYAYEAYTDVPIPDLVKVPSLEDMGANWNPAAGVQ